jgi:hypothetical protein
LPPLEVVVIDVPLIRKAIEVCIRRKLTFWDALVLAAARHAHCDILWTEDLNHGQVVDTVRIENPFLEIGARLTVCIGKWLSNRWLPMVDWVRAGDGRLTVTGRPARDVWFTSLE